MNIVSGLVVVLLVLLSGAVAALGDWLGRRLGKKRLRIGGLRPKHTAIVTTFIAGMLITLVTIVILSLSSEQVRKWLVEGADVQRQLQDARSDLDNAERQLSKGRQDIAAVRKDLEGERAKLLTEQERVKASQMEAAEMRAQAASLKAQATSIQKQLEAQIKELESLTKEYLALEKNRDSLLANIETFRRFQGELDTKNNELLEENEILEAEIGTLQRQIADLNRQVRDSESALSTAKSEFEKEKQQIEADRAGALADLRDAEGQLDGMRRELAFIQRQTYAIQTDTSRAFMNRLIYNRGDELARIAVGSRLSQAEARNYLLAVVDMASEDAEARGAVAGPNSNSTVSFPLLGDVTPDALFQRAVEQIAGKGDEQIVVVRSLFNSFKGGWVSIAVEVLPNELVYRQGDFIIETRIDGSRGVQAVSAALVSFISTQLRERAVRDGMVPAIGRQPELGELTQEQVQQVVGTIVDAGRNVTVRFHAGKDTKAADALTLDIRLR